jgi:hypothetical protein
MFFHHVIRPMPRLDSHGVEKRARRQVVLGPIHKPDGTQMTKREAQRILQPYVDRANSSLGTPARERKSATFDAFAQIWGAGLSFSVKALYSIDYAWTHQTAQICFWPAEHEANHYG